MWRTGTVRSVLLLEVLKAVTADMPEFREGFCFFVLDLLCQSKCTFQSLVCGTDGILPMRFLTFRESTELFTFFVPPILYCFCIKFSS